MAAPDDPEARVAALETRVRELADRVHHCEQDAAAARVLAGGADRDVAEIRGELRDFRQATTASFNAMHDDLTDLRQQMNDGFTEMHGRFTEMDNGFTEMHNGFTEMRGRLDATAAGQQQIVDLLTTLIGEQSDQ